MRLFVSVDVDDLAGAIADVQEPLSGLPGLRLTDPEQAHVTLKFLGDGPAGGERDHDLDGLEAAIEAAVADADVDPFEARLAGVGVFPSPDYIRVVWLGFDAGGEELTHLHAALEEQTTDLGYDPESHEFTPHVTLARMDNAAAKEDVQRYVQESDPEAGTIQIEEIRLKESTLTSDGPEYETVTRFPL